jgi:hypothetical protein
MHRCFLTPLIIAVVFVQSALAGEIRSGQFTFSSWDGPALEVHYIEPAEDDMADAPIVIVMHGVRRNADDYARNWRELAKEYGFRIYAPEFSQRDFKGAELYNLGGIGTDHPSSYAADGYYLFGHSAGAQFVHRALLFEDLDHLKLAFSANAGWYTMPDETLDWPYGIKGTPADEDDLRAWLVKPMMILLGEEDTDPRDRNLRRSMEALKQGPHRFARGVTFINAAKAKADELGVPLIWRGGTVPGIAHDNAGMAIAAAPLIAAHEKNKVDTQP